jgi:predicted O-methyltransferase YrrM
VNRRASLPGVDELFGARNDPGDDTAEAAAGGSPDRAARLDEAAQRTVRRLAAAEDDVIVAARRRAGDALALPIPEVGALLRWAALSCAASHVVEVGAAGGVTGVWLLSALPERGVLTSVEADADAHRLAKDTFREARAGTRVRAIPGDAATVLPRLADGAYDLVVLQGPRSEYPDDLEHARRLLRPGGMLVARGVLQVDEHGDAVGRFVELLVDDASFEVVVLPVDDGIALATRRDHDGGA